MKLTFEVKKNGSDINIFDMWMYDETKAINRTIINRTFEETKEKISELLEEYLV